ncbi:MAG: phage tail protein [Amylibacter sp.]|nr:phage tail protein [Amylibacter sp.]
MRVIFWAFIFLISLAAQASADPVTAAITSFFVSVGASAATAAALAAIVGRIALSTAFGFLSRVINGKRDRGQQGLTTPILLTGDINPQIFIMGTYATSGQLAYPPLTHGPTAYKVFVIAVCAKKSATLERIAIDGAWVEITTTIHADYGNELGGKYAGFGWVKYYDGTQTVADPMLVAKYGAHADFPYTTDMVGAGNCYAIVTLKANTTLFSGNPKILFELGSIPLYDPRLDTTAGGVGLQRWSDDTTWAATENGVVMVYNILRGITTSGDDIWGGQVAEADVPFAIWSAAMDAADGAGYKSGFEAKLDDDPAIVVDELLKSFAGSIADVGGRWIINSGAPQQPTLFITDDDILVSESRTLSPVKSISSLHNAVSISYVSPADVYQPKDADLYIDPVAQAEDGGRRLIAALQMPAVTDAAQVASLQASALADDRQKRVHSLTFPARKAGIEPMDVISWNSAINSYSAQPFEVQSARHDPTTLAQHVTMRAVNYANWQRK